MHRNAWALIATLWLGCCAPTSAPAPMSPPGPADPPSVEPTAPPLPTPGPAYPEGAIAIPCTVRAEIEATLAGDELRLRFVLQNLGPDAAVVTLQGTCPRGLVELGGLPPGFDPMHTCQAGACPRPELTQTFRIPGDHAWVALGETVLRAAGDACNPPLPFGSSFLQARVVADPGSLEVCSGAMVHIVRDRGGGRLRRAGLLDPAVPASPSPSPSKVPVPAKPVRAKPAPITPQPRKQCPACGFGCIHGIPSRKVGADGCPVCGCETLEVTPSPAQPPALSPDPPPTR